MGVKNLLKCLKLEKTNVNYLHHQMIIIDAMYWVHRFKYAYNGDDEMFLNCFKKLLKTLNRKTLFVFDGKFKNSYENKTESFINLVKSQNNQKFNVKHIDQKYFIKLLQNFLEQQKIDFCTAEDEADMEIIRKSSDNSLILSNDTDIILLMGDNIMFNYDWKTGDCDLYLKNSAEILLGGKYIKINKLENFIEMCVLSGTDYHKFKGISLSTAYKITQNGIEDWLKTQTEETITIYNKILKYYKQND